HRRPQRQPKRLPIHHRQRPRQANADRAGGSIRRQSELRAATAEQFRLRLELHVDLEADHNIVRAFAHGWSFLSLLARSASEWVNAVSIVLTFRLTCSVLSTEKRLAQPNQFQALAQGYLDPGGLQ